MSLFSKLKNAYISFANKEVIQNTYVDSFGIGSRKKQESAKAIDDIHNNSFDEELIAKWWTEDPVLFGGITRLADFVSSVGYEVRKDQDNQVKEFFDKISLPYFLRLLTINIATMDVIFVYLRKDMPIVLNPVGMSVVYDRYGNIKGYVQKNNYGKNIKYTPEEVVMLKMNGIGTGITGTSPIIPLQSYLNAKAKAETNAAQYFERNGTPRIHYIVKERNVEKKKLIKERIKHMLPYEDIISDDSLEIKPISNPISDVMYSNWLDYLNSIIRMGIGIPDIIAGFSRDSNKANSRIQYQGFKFRIKALHTTLAHLINTKIIPFYFPNLEAYIVFRDLDMEESNLAAQNRAKIAQALSNYVKNGILSPDEAKRYALEDLASLNSDIDIPLKEGGENEKI